MLARFADELMGHDEGIVLDSCAAPDNVLANVIWGERVEVKDILFTRPTQKAAGRTIRNMINLHRVARKTAKSLIKRG